MKNKITAILDFINMNDNFLLTAHVNADGDAIASVLAASLFLEKLQKQFKIVFHDQAIDPKYSYIKNWNKIESYNDLLKQNLNGAIKAALIFDSPGNSRIGDVNTLLANGMPSLKIDHHPVEDTFNTDDWVDTDASSVSAMIFEIIEQSPVSIDKDLAEALYTGIIFDTGRLSYSNTRARDFEICALLAKAGVDPGKITNAMFFNNNATSLQVIGQGLKNIEQYLNGHVTVITLFNKDLHDVPQYEIEDLASFSVSLRDSEVGAFIREIEPGFFKISLRSKTFVDVSEVARQFDGGGHVRASGCRFEGTYQDLLDKLLNILKKQL
jgi:bifunctional oligoribonuclease and PAP phosphatase NrnA